MSTRGLIYIGITFAFGLILFQNCADFSNSSGSQATALQMGNVVITKAPPSITASTSPVIEFAASSAQNSFQCSMNNGPYESCTSPKQLSNLSTGSYSFSVRLAHASGATSAAEVVNFTVDPTALSVAITSSHTAFSNSRTISVNFSGAGSGVAVSSYECRVDLLSFSACTIPYVLENLNAGAHVVEVRSKDAAGNVSAPARVSWTVDLTAPTITLSSGPSGVISTCNTSESAVFGFSATDSSGSGVKSLTCKLDAGAEESCTTTKTYAAINADGTNHTLVLKATDNAGNVSQVTRTFSFGYYDCNFSGGGSP